MLRKSVRQVVLLTLVIVALAQSAKADSAKDLCDRATPSLVAVQWTWQYEWGRAEYIGAGVIVREDGLIAVPMLFTDPGVADSQMVDFKIIIPSRDNHDEQEIDAVFQGRDERSDLSFVKPKNPDARKWIPIKFADQRAEVGDRVVSIGMLPKDSGYRAYASTGIVGAHLRGEEHGVVVTSGELAASGGVVFNDAGAAIGYINAQLNTNYLLNSTGGDDESLRSPVDPLAPLEFRPTYFRPAAEFLMSLRDPPTPEKPLVYPWIGAGLNGIEKDVAEEFGLVDQPAMEIDDVVAGAPFDKAGLKVGMKIVKVNGQPLERGDLPPELEQIFTRKIQRMKVGDTITVSVLTEKGKPLQDFKVTLEKRPVRQNELPRFWAEDLGFSVRDVTFHDLYTRKQPTDLKGVMVSGVKPESAAASAQLADELIITSLNGEPVLNRENFKSQYEKLRSSKPKEAIVLVAIAQDGQTQTIRIEPPQ